jgi:hypothetical protein
MIASLTMRLHMSASNASEREFLRFIVLALASVALGAAAAAATYDLNYWIAQGIWIMAGVIPTLIYHRYWIFPPLLATLAYSFSVCAVHFSGEPACIVFTWHRFFTIAFVAAILLSFTLHRTALRAQSRAD